MLSDGGAGVAGAGALAQPPSAARHGGVGGHVAELQGGNVLPPTAAPAAQDAGASQQSRTAAAASGGAPAAAMAKAQATQPGNPNVMPDADDDAGMADKPTAPELLKPSKLPAVDGQCPQLNGNGTHVFSVRGRSLMVDIFMRPDAKSMPAPGGPLLMYFHALDADSKEVTEAIGQPAIDAVVAQGGVVASFNAIPCLRCGLADDVVWYDEDDVVSDQVVACAMQQAQIDPRRIHAVGFSSGALHAMHLALARSDYIASVVSFSGGVPATPREAQDPTNKVASLLSYGREGVDNAVVDFNISSHDWYTTYVPQGYYVLMCAHGRGHEIPKDLPAHILRFLLDHPYRVSPEPYTSKIPAELPSYCRNTP